MVRTVRLCLGLLVFCTLGLSPIAAGAKSAVGSATTTYRPTSAFDPKSAATAGSTDVYHCSLFDPQITTDRYITSSQLLVDRAKEVHHAIYFLLSPEQVATATALNQNGKGWTCFGDPLNRVGSFGGTIWLGAWAPGVKTKPTPPGTGILLPKGSQVVVQVHYNLLHGSKPDHTGVQLTTAPLSSSIIPMRIVQLPAPPDLPCPAGVMGPLCDRAASLVDLGQRFGPAAVAFVDQLENLCRHDYANPATVGRTVSTSCTIPVPAGVKIRQATLHMHLLGQSASIELVRGGTTITLGSVAHYNFDYQRTYRPPGGAVETQAGDQLRVRCSYSPWLRGHLAETKHVEARYVTWGDGSSDEMCLGILAVTAR